MEIIAQQSGLSFKEYTHTLTHMHLNMFMSNYNMCMYWGKMSVKTKI